MDVPRRRRPDGVARPGVMPRWLMGPGRVAAKHLVNPLVMSVAGRLGPYGVVRHVGRRSHRAYATPVWAGALGDDFVIALVLGTETDWFRNTQAAGQCTLQLHGVSYTLTEPEVVDRATALRAFPAWIRMVARLLGLRYFLKMRRGSAS